MLTYAAWRSRFGGSHDVLSLKWGRPVSYHVVGVLPRDFILPSSRFLSRYDGLYVNPSKRYAAKGFLTVAPFARLRTGATWAAAEQELNRIARSVPWGDAEIHRAYFTKDMRIEVLPLQEGLTLFWKSRLRIAATAMAAVLAVTCVNVSLLLLTRVRLRARDLGIESALGATRARLSMESLLDTAALCMVAGVLATAGASMMSKAIVAVAPPLLRMFVTTAADAQLTLCIVLLAFVFAVVAGVTPATVAGRARALRSLSIHTGAQRSRSTASLVFVALQAAFGAFVVSGGAAEVPRFADMLLRSPGFQSRDLFTLTVGHGFPGFNDREASGRPVRVRRILEQIREMPNVRDAGASLALPFGPSVGQPLRLVSDSLVSGHVFWISDGVLEALGVPVMAGRSFREWEISERGLVAVVNQAAARALLPGLSLADVVGKVVRTNDGPRRIVGVVGDISVQPGERPLPALFLPITSTEAVVMSSELLVSVRMSPGSRPDRAAARRLLEDVFGERGGVGSEYVPDTLAPAFDRPRFIAVVLGGLSFMVLLLVSVASYALTTCEVATRRYELAVRLALGSTLARAAYSLLGPVMGASLVGTIVGLAGARCAAQYGIVEPIVDQAGPGVYVATAGLVLGSAIVAMLVPLWRMARMDVAAQLRT